MGLVSASPAAADRIGSSHLPPSAPPLKGRIVEDEAATSAVVVATGVGATSNAGPTLSEQPSAFLDRALGYATSRTTGLGHLDANVNLADRHYTAFEEAYEQSIAASASLTRDWSGAQTLATLAFSKNRDVEERLTEISLSVAHAGTAGKVRPYVKAETALLDYGDIPDGFHPFRNQDDRDRISSRATLGLRLTLTDRIDIEIGAGIDRKHYLERFDDFGIRRGNLSLFPLLGLGYTSREGSLRALYMPLWRTYSEDAFESAWKNAYAVEGDMTLADGLKGFAAVRYGFEETDFLIASAAYEAVAVAGLTLATGKGTLTLAASRTWRTYDHLELADLARADDKLEVALYGELPLIETVSLTGRLGYLDYASSFGRASTEAVTASVGLTYAATH
jgi:hypothetical protein